MFESSPDVGNQSTIETIRACDRCRRLKRRCESIGFAYMMLDTENSEATAAKYASNAVETIFFAPTRPQPRLIVRTVVDIHEGSYTQEYVRALELRFRNADKALLKLRESTQHIVSGSLIKYLDPPEPDDGGPHGIAASFQALALNGPPPDPGFQGESSSAMLAKAAVAFFLSVDRGGLEITAMTTNVLYEAQPKTHDQPARAGIGVKESVTAELHLIVPPPRKFVAIFSGGELQRLNLGLSQRKWNEHHRDITHLSFPDSRLLGCLVSLYFENFNIFIPVLYRPSFEDGLARHFHMRHDGFTSTLLLVLALGSLYLKDPGISSSAYYGIIGIPYVQDSSNVGCSNRDCPGTRSHYKSFRNEDKHQHLCRHVSPLLVNCRKKPVAALQIQPKNYRKNLKHPEACKKQFVFLDVRLPSQCDDQWWQLSGPGYQPKRISSTIAFFNCLVGLYHILHFLEKNIYSTSRVYTASGIEDLQTIAAELDAKLSRWFNSIPQHLIWHPKCPDGIFFDQSAALCCFYHYIRMLIHRPFFPAKGPTNLPRVESYSSGRGRHAVAGSPFTLITTAAGPLPASSTVLERLLSLDYAPAEGSNKLSDEAPSDDSASADTIAAVSAGTAHGNDGPKPWIVFAQAWLTGIDPPFTPHAFRTFPVFAGDQEVAPTQNHRPHGFLVSDEA
ncbi:hypothetical protein DFH08DRAFT_814626 [Mycena albidolilacea]|uniref:Uncharacterized protein n=1 Tax=Mycena albidolilacea TaxID=1033008 RepID=A0AAD6ZPE1_9AGAR|nr:hypothetical protein DFH08DRAFT_814626 [Mycena albidolilacea]